jgi:hypothetical protein
VAARSVYSLAVKIWVGIRAAECKLRAQSFLRELASAAETLRALCPQRSEGRGLACSGPPAIIESQKAH